MAWGHIFSSQKATRSKLAIDIVQIDARIGRRAWERLYREFFAAGPAIEMKRITVGTVVSIVGTGKARTEECFASYITKLEQRAEILAQVLAEIEFEGDTYGGCIPARTRQSS